MHPTGGTSLPAAYLPGASGHVATVGYMSATPAPSLGAPILSLVPYPPLRGMLPLPPRPASTPNHRHDVPLEHFITPADGGGSVISPRPLGRAAARVSKTPRSGRRTAMPSTRQSGVATLTQTPSAPSSEVESIGEYVIDSAEEDTPEATKAVVTTVRRCFASVRSALSTQQAQTAELTRLVQVCASKLYQQSITSRSCYSKAQPMRGRLRR